MPAPALAAIAGRIGPMLMGLMGSGGGGAAASRAAGAAAGQQANVMQTLGNMMGMKAPQGQASHIIGEGVASVLQQRQQGPTGGGDPNDRRNAANWGQERRPIGQADPWATRPGLSTDPRSRGLEADTEGLISRDQGDEMLDRLGQIARSTGIAGSVLAAGVGLVKGVEAMGARRVDAQRQQFGALNAQIAMETAQLDVNRLRRQIELGRRVQTSNVRMVQAQNALEDQLADYQAIGMAAGNTLQMLATRATQFGLTALERQVPFGTQIREWLADSLEAEGKTAGTNFQRFLNHMEHLGNQNKPSGAKKRKPKKRP